MLTRIFKILHWLFLISGIALLIVNIMGLALNDRLWPKPENGRHGAEYRPYSSEMKKIMEKEAQEKLLDYAERMNVFVYNHTEHYFPKKINLANLDITAVPFLWNWAIWLRAFWALLTHEHFVVEFCDAETGLMRGYGLCSQRSLILQDILRKQRIDARATKLYGHVVCMMRIDGKEILLDPDHGFSIPHGLDFLHEHPETIYKYSPSDAVSTLYLPILERGKWRDRGNVEYGCAKSEWLRKMRFIQWLTPFFLIIFAYCFKWACRRKKEAAGSA